MPYAELPAWYDVDVVDDLQRLRRDLPDPADATLEYRELIRLVVATLDGDR